MLSETLYAIQKHLRDKRRTRSIVRFKVQSRHRQAAKGLERVAYTPLACPPSLPAPTEPTPSDRRRCCCCCRFEPFHTAKRATAAELIIPPLLRSGKKRCCCGAGKECASVERRRKNAAAAAAAVERGKARAAMERREKESTNLFPSSPNREGSFDQLRTERLEPKSYMSVLCLFLFVDGTINSQWREFIL